MQLIEKLCFYKIEQIFNPYPPAPFPMERGRIRGLASLRPALGLRPKPYFANKIYNSSID